MSDPLKIKQDQQYGSTGGFVWGMGTGNITDQTDLVAYIASHSGGVATANDGLSMSGSTAILGGLVLQDKILDFATNDKNIWFKAPLNPNSDHKHYSVIIGSTNTSQWTSYDASLLISKNSNDNFNNAVMLSMVCGDVTGINGWQFLNYQDTPGQILPNLRVASNATAGESAAFNVDMIGRDSRSDFSHFSMWYYDYDDYVINHNNAVGMSNSNFINFTNGSGGNPASVNFFFVDKHYNWMIGNHPFAYRPAGNLDIGDNSSTYSIYQQGAGSANWFAGKTKIGGAASVASVQLEINVASGKSVSEPFIKFNNSSASEVGRINFTASDVFIGLGSGSAFTTSGGAINTGIGYNALGTLTSGDGNVAMGWNAMVGTTTGRQNTAIGAAAGRGVNSRGNVLIGIITGDLNGGDPGGGTLGDFNTIVGSETVQLTTGGAVGSGNILLGAFSVVADNVLGDNNILIGNSIFTTAAFSNSIYIVTNPSGTATLSNIIALGDNRHNTIMGLAGTSLADNGNRLQVTGNVYVSTLSGTGTRMVVANSTGVLSTQTIPTSPVTSVFGRTGVVVAAANDYTFAQLASKPTTIAGYGITDTISQPITGYVSGAGVVAATDSILQAIQKLNGNDGNLTPTSRTLTGTSPILIDAVNTAKDLSANRTISWDFTVANTWTGLQTMSTTTNGGAVLNLAQTTAATSSGGLSSGVLEFSTFGWKTNATAASVPLVVKNYMASTTAAVAATPILVWSYNLNGAGDINWFNISYTGISVASPCVSIQPNAGSGFEVFCNTGAIILRNGAGIHLQCATTNVTTLSQNVVAVTNAMTVGTSLTVASTGTSIGLFSGGLTLGASSTVTQSGNVLTSLGGGLLTVNQGGPTNGLLIGQLAGNPATTAGLTAAVTVSASWAPTSGTANFTALNFNHTINQTGGASGTTRAIYINPTLTAAVDYRAIDIVTGKVVFAPSVTARAPINTPSGTAPTSPNNGDIWFDGTNLFMRIAGTTKTFTIV